MTRKPKNKSCRNPECGKEFQPYKSTDKYCSYTCQRECEIDKMTKKAMKVVEKLRRDKRRAQKEEDKQKLMELMTKSELAKEIQYNSSWGVNKLIREIDKGHGCISGSTAKKQFHAGHYHTVGAHPELRFNLLNIWNQSAQDNHFGSGNIHGYRNGIMLIGGQELLDEMDGLPLLWAKLNTVKSDFLEMIPKLKELHREAKKLPKKLPSKARIEIRREYNKRIGIYVEPD